MKDRGDKERRGLSPESDRLEKNWKKNCDRKGEALGDC